MRRDYELGRAGADLDASPPLVKYPLIHLKGLTLGGEKPLQVFP